MRVARLVKHDEVVVNMFAGVGCFSLIIAKYSSASRVYSIDVNPEAVQLMRENVRLNRAYGRVIPILGDAKEVVEGRLRCSASRILMPLPEKALEFLPHAVSALTGSRGWIHYYGFEHAGKNEGPIEKVKLKVARKLGSVGVDFEIPFSRVVRSTGPNWFQVVLDVLVNR
jgi:tRNA (guanine37-N1)-methyltransferase